MDSEDQQVYDDEIVNQLLLHFGTDNLLEISEDGEALIHLSPEKIKYFTNLIEEQKKANPDLSENAVLDTSNAKVYDSTFFLLCRSFSSSGYEWLIIKFINYLFHRNYAPDTEITFSRCPEPPHYFKFDPLYPANTCQTTVMKSV